MIRSGYFCQVKRKTSPRSLKRKELSSSPIDKLTLENVIENIYTNLNALKIGQYHWQCTQTLINKLVNCIFSTDLFTSVLFATEIFLFL